MRRAAFGVLTIFGVSIIIFVVMRLLPGDLLAVMYGEGATKLTDADRAKIMQELHLSDPLYQQYVRWMKDLASGKLGVSFFRGDNVADLILRRGPLSAEIGLLAVLISWMVGLPVGMVSALRPNSVLDNGARVMSILFLAVPGFWLGMLIVLALLFWFNYKAPLTVVHIWQDPWTNLQLVIGPAVVLGLGQAAYIARMARSSLLEVIREDYVRTARAKGLPENLVIWKHAFRNALIPIITLLGLMLPELIGGSFIFETIFSYPGMGRLGYEAIMSRDYPLLMGIGTIVAILTLLGNLVADLLYAFVDPRIRYQ